MRSAWRRLICNADLGHRNRNRKEGTESHAFYDVRRYADGTVGAHYGVLGNEAHGGQHIIIGLNLSEAAAMRLFEKEVNQKVRQGYHERSSVLEEAEAEPPPPMPPSPSLPEPPPPALQRPQRRKRNRSPGIEARALLQ